MFCKRALAALSATATRRVSLASASQTCTRRTAYTLGNQVVMKPRFSSTISSKQNPSGLAEAAEGTLDNIPPKTDKKHPYLSQDSKYAQVTLFFTLDEVNLSLSKAEVQRLQTRHHQTLNDSPRTTVDRKRCGAFPELPARQCCSARDR